GRAGHHAGDLADLLVADPLLVVAHGDEPLVDDVHLGTAQAVAEVLAAIGQGVAAAVLAQHQAALRHAHRARLDDLVGGALLEEAILVDAGLVGEGVGADDGLVGLGIDADDLGEQLAGREEVGRVDAGLEVEDVLADPHGHHHLLERTVAGALADAVDGALDLPRAALHAGQRVGHGQAQIVVAVDADDGLGAQRLGHPADDLAVLV